MGVIKILDENLSNMIAAGEVVENPSSLVKELLENSLDANSKYIRIDVKNGGKILQLMMMEMECLEMIYFYVSNDTPQARYHQKETYLNSLHTDLEAKLFPQ